MLSTLILQQKIAARKAIAKLTSGLKNLKGEERFNMMKVIGDERDFLNYDFSKIDNISDLVDLIHRTRFSTRSKMPKYAAFRLIAEEPINLPGAPAENPSLNPDGDIKPLFGNLISLLEQEVTEELDRLNLRRVPSQNDLTRWALKDAVLAFYQGLNLPPNTKIVQTVFDDRLVPQLAPDFDVIHRMWLDRLYNLTRRDDKFTLESGEYEKAEKDVAENETGMRGSAFEKQLDRYREEFMQKLQR